MKWLEGWLGTFVGVVGAVGVILVALLTPLTRAYPPLPSTAIIVGDGSGGAGFTQYGPGAPTGPNIAAIIFAAVVTLLFVGVLVGTWLDLRGRRTAGRLTLLTSATLLLPGLFALFSAASEPYLVLGSEYIGYFLPLIGLALLAGVIACLRGDLAWRFGATPAPVAPPQG